MSGWDGFWIGLGVYLGLREIGVYLSNVKFSWNPTITVKRDESEPFSMTRPLQLAEQVLREPRSHHAHARVAILAQRVIEMEKAVREWAEAGKAVHEWTPSKSQATLDAEIARSGAAVDALRSLLADAGGEAAK